MFYGLFAFDRSLGQDLLSYIVDIIVPEIATKSPINENDFKSLLEWRDIWTVLFTIKGKWLYCNRSPLFDFSPKFVFTLSHCWSNVVEVA